jgi:hypothetical protein
VRINAYKEQNYAYKARIKMLEDEMSRMGDWVIEMQEDCIYMDRGPWIEKYGTRFAYIYDEQLRVVAPVDPDPEVEECLR